MVVEKCKYESYNTARINIQHFFVNAGEIWDMTVVRNMLEGAT